MAERSYTGGQPQAKCKEDSNGSTSKPKVPAIFTWSDCARRSNGDCNYLVCLDGDIFMKGGDQLFQYKHIEDHWTMLPFAKRLYCGMCIWDGRLALIGGKEGHTVLAGATTIYRSSSDTLTGSVIVRDQERWVGTNIPAMPVPCMWPAVVADPGSRKLLVIGGMDVEGRPVSHVQIYDGSTKAWHCAQELPKACSNASCTIWEQSIFLIGGDGLGTDVYCANLSELHENQEMQANSLLTAHTSVYNVWKKLPSLQYKFSALCIIDGVIVAIGGIDSAGRIKTSSVYALSTTTMMWRRVGDLHFPCVCLGIVLPNSELLCIERGAGTRIFKGKANGLSAHLQQLDGTWPMAVQQELAGDWIGVNMSIEHF